MIKIFYKVMDLKFLTDNVKDFKSNSTFNIKKNFLDSEVLIN